MASAWPSQNRVRFVSVFPAQSSGGSGLRTYPRPPPRSDRPIRASAKYAWRVAAANADGQRLGNGFGRRQQIRNGGEESFSISIHSQRPHTFLQNFESSG